MHAILTLLLACCTAVATAEQITIPGSGSGAKPLMAAAKAFMKAHPEVAIDVPTESSGSGGAIRSVGTGESALGRVGRPLKKDEEGFALQWIPYAIECVVFVVHPDIKVTNLTPAQLCAIYDGTTTNWSALGGPEEAIRVIHREEGSSTLETIREQLPGFKDLKILEKSLTSTSTQQTLTAMEKGRTIGFLSYTDAKDNAAVRIVTIDGKGPAEAGYVLQKKLALVVKKDGLGGSAKAFVDFILSAEGQEIISKAGAQPIGK